MSYHKFNLSIIQARTPLSSVRNDCESILVVTDRYVSRYRVVVTRNLFGKVNYPVVSVEELSLKMLSAVGICFEDSISLHVRLSETPSYFFPACYSVIGYLRRSYFFRQ